MLLGFAGGVCLSREKAKGSFTAEAALLQGILLWIFFLVIGVYWYCHNQIWFTAAACEAAAAGKYGSFPGTEERTRDNPGSKISQIREMRGLLCGGAFSGKTGGKDKDRDQVQRGEQRCFGRMEREI